MQKLVPTKLQDFAVHYQLRNFLFTKVSFFKFQRKYANTFDIVIFNRGQICMYKADFQDIYLNPF